MKKLFLMFCVLGLMNAGFAMAEDATHHDAKSEKAEHVICSDHDDHCKSDEMGIEKKEHEYCAEHKEHCKQQHGKKKHPKNKK